MNEKMKMMLYCGLALGFMAIVGASVLGVDEFLALFSGVSEIVDTNTGEPGPVEE